MDSTLYDLSTKYRELNSRDDLDADTLKDTLDSIEEPMADKLDNIASLMDTNEADADWLGKRIKQLQAKKKRLEATNERLSKYIVDSLNVAEISKIHTSQHIISLGRTSTRTVVDTEEFIPFNYYKEVLAQHKLDIEGLKKDLKQGVQIKGVHLEERRKAVIE